MPIKNSIADWALFGGEKAFASFRTTMNLFPPDEELFFRYARRSFEARQFTNNGPAVLELEKRLAEFHDVKHCVAFCTGFTGMFLTMRHAGLPGKKEVIVQSLTYRRMADIIAWAGFTPRFCDVDEKTLGPSRETVEACINENTALILAAHPRTRLCDIDGLEELAGERHLPLMFDSVEACGASHRGKMLGGFGLCEAFSMHADKIINGAEGGYVTTNNAALARKLTIARAFGFAGVDHIECLGFNGKLNELHAAMALSSLAGIEKQMAANRELHLAYQKHLDGLPGIEVVDYDREERRNWRSLLARLGPEWPFSREQTLALLNAENIHARPYYSPPQHMTFKRQAGKGEIPLPVTEKAASNHLILPFGATVSIEDTAIIGQVFRDMLGQARELRRRLEAA